MKVAWLTRGRGERLRLFFAGWGMEPGPFMGMREDRGDVLMVYDYTDAAFPVDLAARVDAYDECHLIAWSLGVSVANGVCRDLRLSSALAVNGTLVPVDDLYGIPPALFDGTIEHLLSGGWTRFVRRMCGNAEAGVRFERACSERTVEDRLAELRVLRQSSAAEACIFERAIAGRQDRIVPFENQVRAWEHFGVPCRVVNQPHFPFSDDASWEECFDDSDH
jgi:biotin synthesis protein BioG